MVITDKDGDLWWYSVSKQEIMGHLVGTIPDDVPSPLRWSESAAIIETPYLEEVFRRCRENPEP